MCIDKVVNFPFPSPPDRTALEVSFVELLEIAQWFIKKSSFLLAYENITIVKCACLQAVLGVDSACSFNILLDAKKWNKLITKLIK